jgi:hypothetical protein
MHPRRTTRGTEGWPRIWLAYRELVNRVLQLWPVVPFCSGGTNRGCLRTHRTSLHDGLIGARNRRHPRWAQNHNAMAEPSRRFPPPWRPDKIPGGYVVRDANGQALRSSTAANEDEARQANVLTTDEARRVAVNARLPELLGTGETALSPRPRGESISDLLALGICREEANAGRDPRYCRGHHSVYGGIGISPAHVQLSMVRSDIQKRRQHHVVLFHDLSGLKGLGDGARRLLLPQSDLPRPRPPLSLRPLANCRSSGLIQSVARPTALITMPHL